ncbi:hypothetical protein DVH05_019834 [Phytophthora capsici]|nr:hypothetical protein DVH05_019834 [Phytophthora capsici]
MSVALRTRQEQNELSFKENPWVSSEIGTFVKVPAMENVLPRSNSEDGQTITILAPDESSVASRSLSAEIPTTYQPNDWSSEDGARVDGSARRIAINLPPDSNTAASESTLSLPGSTGGGNSFRSNSGAKQDATDTPSPPANTTVHPLTLYGKDILRIFPFGATTDADDVKWSDTLGTVDTEDDFSIRDPHFDLTNAKITKLFSLSNPNGNSKSLFSGFLD